MRNLVLFVLLPGLTFLGWRDEGISVEVSVEPYVVLEGEGKAELAPHGKGNVYAPHVIHDGKVYKMWYGGQGKDGHDRISYAESGDAKKWLHKGVVLKDDKSNHVNDPSVVVVQGRYYMYYSRTEKYIVDRIDVATSDDGIKWESKGVALAAGTDGEWDALSVGRPSVLVQDGLFKMWYDGRKDFPPDAPVKDVPKSDKSRRSVGYATSKDGLTWERHKASPVFDHDAGGVDVKRLGNRFIMLIESRSGTTFAISKDGIKWKDGGIFAPKSTSTIDAFGHVTPFLLLDKDSGVHRLFVGAAAISSWDQNRIAVIEISGDRLKGLVSTPKK